MNEYPSNSYKSKSTDPPQQEPQREGITQHPTQIAEKTPMQKFIAIAIKEDMSSIRSNTGSDILKLVVPKVKQMFLQILETLINSNRGSYSGPKQSVTSISYKDYYDHGPEINPKRYDYPDFNNILFDDRGDAERVKDLLVELTRSGRVAKVADMFEFARIKDIPYTANDYGWTNLESAKIMQRGNKWMIQTPKAMPVSKY